jgi:hypothetical protein
VQQITNTPALAASRSAVLGESVVTTLKFLGDSLSTVALGDGRLLAATRSASREIDYIVENVRGFDAPQVFRARLSAQIEITECKDDSCLAPRRAP